MKFFFDTEFMESGGDEPIHLISIGLVAEDGQEFYRQNAQAPLRYANTWVQDNVLPKLWQCPKNITGARHVYGLCADPKCVWRPKRQIRDELYRWVNEVCYGRALEGVNEDDGPKYLSGHPEFWAYYASYDWVVLCQLFGTMMSLPSSWPRWCRDLKQYQVSVGRFDLPPEPRDEHNALSDARWLKYAYEYVEEVERDHARRKKSRAEYQEPEGVRGTEEEVRGLPGGEDSGGEDQQLTSEGPEDPAEEMISEGSPVYASPS